MEQQLQQFLQFLQLDKRLSPNSITSYKHDLQMLYRYLQSNQTLNWHEVEPIHLQKYMYYLKKEQKQSATIARYWSSINTFFQYLQRNNVIDHNPAAMISPPKVEARELHILTIEMAQQLLQLPDTTTLMGKRDKAILELLYASGLKVSELIALDVSDIKLELAFVQCNAMQQKERIVPIGKHALLALAEYMNQAREQLITARTVDSALFLNHLGTRLTRQGCWKIFKSYAEKAGCPPTITPQSLRQSVAVHMLENGASVTMVQEMLGHHNLATTLRYLPTGDGRLRENYEQSHPRA